MRLFSILCALIFLTVGLSIEVAAKDFGSFVTTEGSAPGSVKRVRNRASQGPTKSVWQFNLPAGYCNPKPYETGLDDSDCKYKSARSSRYEKGGSKAEQPKEAWYGWWVYFPADFPYGNRQTRGHYEFAYWHNRFCPHLTFASDAGTGSDLYLQTNARLGGYDCKPTLKQKVASFSELVGRWTRFEVRVIWSEGNDGLADVYINGKLRTRHRGRTLTRNAGPSNYFVHGVYLCCTRDVASIRQATVVFGDVSRARRREDLR